MYLDTLGWDERREAEFGPHRAEGLEPGRVSLEHNHVYRVITTRGEGLAEAAGRIKYLASGRREMPAVGDWVAVKPNPAGDRDVIQAILPRRTFFSRKAAGRETEEQVIAANVDTVLIVFGLDTHVKPRALERYVTLARRAGAQPVIVLNKSDLAEDPAADVADAVTGRWGRAGPRAERARSGHAGGAHAVPLAGPDRGVARAFRCGEVLDRQSTGGR
jgi:ribosome biogenesis GTPase